MFESASAAASEEVLEELIEEIIRGVVYDVHRAAKTGILFCSAPDVATDNYVNDDNKEEKEAEMEQLVQRSNVLKSSRKHLTTTTEIKNGFGDFSSVEENQYKVCLQVGKDVFGVSVDERRAQLFEVKCDICGRVVVHSRFAPHIMKCMGHGRNSKRAASKRIAALNEELHSSAEEQDSDLEPPIRKQPRNRVLRAGRGNCVKSVVPNVDPVSFQSPASTFLKLPTNKVQFPEDSDEVDEGWKELSIPSPSSVSTGSSNGSHKRSR